MCSEIQVMMNTNLPAIQEDQITKHKAEFKQFLSSNYPNFIIDSNNKFVLDFLFKYFCGYDLPTNTSIIKSVKVSHEKGIMLMGRTGVGKTCLMSIFAKLASVAFAGCDDIRLEYEKSGSACIEKYGKRSFAPDYNTLYSTPDKTKPIHYLLDDLGAEREAVFYGKREEVMESIINHRYEMFEQTGMKTFLTTNLTMDMISERYGDRILSRIKGMCNILHLSGDDMRV